jgi:hypothetical protein
MRSLRAQCAPRRQQSMALLALSVFAVGFSGCGFEVPQEARRQVVRAVFDPAASSLPSPNDLALQDGKVAIAPHPLLSEVENQLRSSFNGKNGFSPASTARVQFSGPLSAASIDEKTVLALDLGPGGKGPQATPIEVTRTYSPCDRSISLGAPGGFTPGHKFLFAVRGGDSGLRGEAGEQVAPSPAFHLLRAGQDLREHPDAMPGTSRAEKAQTAARLEELRGSLEPLFQLAETHGLPRREVVALWSFTAHDTGEVLFDPARKKVPFPNDLLRDPVTGRVSLPIDPAEGAEAQALKRGFNQLDGFSTTAEVWLETSVPLDRNTFAGSVKLFRADTLEEITDVAVTLSEDASKVSIQPRTPLRAGTTFVVTLSGVKDAGANPLGAMPVPSILRLPQPIVSPEGRSLISSLCDPVAARLEVQRRQVSEVLRQSGLSRDTTTAYAFTTQDIAQRSQALWSAPYEQALPLELKDVKLQNPPLLPIMNNVSQILSARFTTLDFLDPTTRAFRENGKGEPREIELFLTLPRSARPGTPVPIVVFGHGLTTERRMGTFLANRLAQQGFAMAAIDMPYHGERSVCMADGDCDSGGQCTRDGVCLKDGTTVGLARWPDIYPTGRGGTPRASGAAFIDQGNLIAQRDHFRQAYVDYSALTRLLRFANWKEATNGLTFDPNKLLYAGISLGGIVGGGLSGMEPHFEAMLLNAGGAGLLEVMRDSLTFGPQLRQGLDQRGLKEGTPEYQSFLNAARWALDEIDPLNLARFARREPLVYLDHESKQSRTAPIKRMRLQFALGDTVIPNTATDRLGVALGINPNTDIVSFLGSHAFLANPLEPASWGGQDDVANFLEGRKQ